ncbi:tetratricopeptide repeat protein [Methylomagnum sp.]
MKAKSSPPKPIPELEAAALRALKGRSYKDAIVLLKDLLKREKRRDWEERLAEAYLGRAREVAGKAMFQEAALLWENHAGFHPNLPPSAEYLGWLLQANQTAKLGPALAAAPEAALQSPEGRRLLEAVALLALGNDKLLNALPKDHTIVKQQALAKQAIAAYSAQRDAEVEDCLRQFSSRSPYRNLRPLLKGLLTLEQNPAAAQEALERVDADSACRSLAVALAEQAEAPRPEAASYLALAAKQRAVIDKLKGYGKAQLALQRDIQKAAQAKGARPLLETVLRYRNELGDNASRRFCLAALVDCPDAIPVYERAYGKLSRFDYYRLQALHEENARYYGDAEDNWLSCLHELNAAPEGARQPLTQALIHRHIAEFAEPEMPHLAIKHLEQSLALDPDDKASYLKLIELRDHGDDPKASQAWLDRALKQYPKDPDVLLMAMQSAQRRKAFKKAASYAKSLLDIDPINSQARRHLLEAHLGHARKQLKSDKLDAAAQELAEARQLDPQRRNPALLYAEGVLAFLQDDLKRCRELWREASTAAGGGVAAWFQWAMEALGADLNLTTAGRYTEALDKKHVPDKTELATLVKRLGQYQGEGRQAIAQVLQKLGPMLKRSFKQAALSETDFIGLCEGFANAGQYELLAECAKQGNRRNQFPPIFSYFEVFAKCKGDAAKLDTMGQFRLQMNLEHAHHDQDRRTTALIDGFLRKHEESLLPNFDNFFPGGSALDDLDEGDARRFIERFEALDQLTPEERAKQLLGEHSPEVLQNLSEKEAMELIFGKLFEGLDMDPSEILDGFPLPGGGKKPKKKR